jgi:hypothetical protein
MNLAKIMKNIKNKQYKVIRVSKEEFELESGDVYPIPFEMDEVLTVEEFQTKLDESKNIMINLLNNNG